MRTETKKSILAVMLLVIIIFYVPQVSVYAQSGKNCILYAGQTKQKQQRKYYQNIVAQETKWLLSLQLSNGCYPMTSYKTAEKGRVLMNPYFADSVALALLESGGHKKSVKKYLSWHFSHLNTKSKDINGLDGTIYDYWEYVDTKTGKVKKEIVYTKNKQKFYDSTDSYAALFLSVLWKYYQTTGDKAYLLQHKKDVKKVVHVIQATMRNGLSIATPSYPTQYLMDNAEVYRGLTDGIKLFQKIYPKETKSIQQMKSSQSQIKKNIEKKMWHKGHGGYYDSALERHGNDKFIPPAFSWNNFYMDATAQLYVITNKVVSALSTRAKTVYKNFNRYWSTGKAKHNWSKISIPDSYYWGELVYAASLMKDTTRVEQYMKTYQKKVKKSSHAYPLYNADAAKVVRAALQMIR